MKDFRLNWAPLAQPLGDALREPVVIIDDIKAMECDSFRFVCHDIPEPMAGKAKAEPAVAPAVDVQPAAFKVGDRVLVHGEHTGTIRGFSDVTGGLRIAMDSGTYCLDENGLAMFSRSPSCIELIEPAQREQVVKPMARPHDPLRFGARP